MSYAEDRAAIVELLTRYAHSCDRREFAAAGDCFTADAQAEYSGVRLPPGVEHIVAHLRPLARLPATQHLIGSVSVTVTGDTATAFSYAVAHLVRPRDGDRDGDSDGDGDGDGYSDGDSYSDGDGDGDSGGYSGGDGEHEVVHRGLCYDDRLVRTGDGWRIRKRVHRVLWSTREPTTWPVPGFR